MEINVRILKKNSSKKLEILCIFEMTMNRYCNLCSKFTILRLKKMVIFVFNLWSKPLLTVIKKEYLHNVNRCMDMWS
jgi:hypothetical protein